MEIYKIFIDRLNNGGTLEIKEEVGPDFLSVKDGRLVFDEKIAFQGRAYLAEEHLVISLDVATVYKAWCRICNDLVPFALDLKGVYITEEIQNIKAKIYHFQEALREAILVEIPMYHECGGDCPERETIQQYLARN